MGRIAKSPGDGCPGFEDALTGRNRTLALSGRPQSHANCPTITRWGFGGTGCFIPPGIVIRFRLEPLSCDSKGALLKSTNYKLNMRLSTLTLILLLAGPLAISAVIEFRRLRHKKRKEQYYNDYKNNAKS